MKEDIIEFLIIIGIGVLIFLGKIILAFLKETAKNAWYFWRQAWSPFQVIAEIVGNMTHVQGGTFSMGATAEQELEIAADNERPVHEVTLYDYYICAYPVTWEDCVAVEHTPLYGYFLTNMGSPVDEMSTFQTSFFIKKLSEVTTLPFRLPTEAEWEFAARGGLKSRGTVYSGNNNIALVADYGNVDDEPANAGSASPNELGIYDMSGGLWERCSDLYGPYSSEPQTNPQGPHNGTDHVVRGGCYKSEPADCRVSARKSMHDVGMETVGIRMALPGSVTDADMERAFRLLRKKEWQRRIKILTRIIIVVLTFIAAIVADRWLSD